MYQRCVLISGGGGSLETYATLDIITKESNLAGKNVDIAFQDASYLITSTRFSSILSSDGFYHTEPINVQSFGDYTISCDASSDVISVTEFGTIIYEFSSILYGLVPKMTTDTTYSNLEVGEVGGVVKYSYYAAARNGYRAFDRSTSNDVIVGATSGTLPAENTYLGFKFDKPVKVKKITFKNTYSSSRERSAFSLYYVIASNDDFTTRDVLTSTLVKQKNVNAEDECSIVTSKRYNEYRVIGLDGEGRASGYVIYPSMQFYGFE